VTTSAQNATAIVFPRCVDGTELLTHYAIGLRHSGPTVYMWSGRLSTPMSVVPGFTPSFPVDACSFGIGSPAALAEGEGQMGLAFRRALMLWLCCNEPIADVGSGVRGADLPGSIVMSLHRGDLGPHGDQSTNEARYRGYARVPISRSRSGLTVTESDEG
jgi:hypothetical protein